MLVYLDKHKGIWLSFIKQFILIVRLICLWERRKKKETKSTPVLFTVRTTQRKKEGLHKIMLARIA